MDMYVPFTIFLIVMGFFFNAILVCLHSFYVCMYVCMAVLGLRFCARAFSSCGKRGHSSSRCVDLSPSRPLVAKHRLQTCRLSSCGSRAELLRGMWDLPRPGLEPASPALAGRFSTTAPPGKPWVVFVGPFLLLCFPFREVPFAFVLELIWWC